MKTYFQSAVKIIVVALYEIIENVYKLLAHAPGGSMRSFRVNKDSERTIIRPRKNWYQD